MATEPSISLPSEICLVYLKWRFDSWWCRGEIFSFDRAVSLPSKADTFYGSRSVKHFQNNIFYVHIGIIQCSHLPQERIGRVLRGMTLGEKLYLSVQFPIGRFIR